MQAVKDRYDVRSALGEGGFGKVYLASRREDNQMFAIKVLNAKVNSVEAKYYREEVLLLRSLRHPFIVSMEEAHEVKGQWCIVMEYCERGDLRTLLDNHLERETRLIESEICSIFCQLLLAIHHCHTPMGQRPPILHRDIKPENVLFTASGQVRLADFGLAKLLKPQAFFKAYSHVGTVGYQAPEIQDGKAYDTKADIYGLGCLTFELCELRRPKQGVLPPDAVIDSRYSEDLRRLVHTMLSQDPKSRPSTSAMLALPTVSSWLHCHHHTDQQMRMREAGALLAKREALLKAGERALHAREATLKVRARKLKLRASLSPEPELELPVETQHGIGDIALRADFAKLRLT